MGQVMEKRVGMMVRLGVALASGGLLPLCFPPAGWWPLMFVVVAALLWATRDVTPRVAFYLGVLHGMVGYVLTLTWFFHIFGAGAVALHAILAFFPGLTCALIAATRRCAGSDWLRALIVAVLWTAVEYYRCEWFWLRFPWVTPGVALGPTWLSPVIGVYGATFLTVAACAGLVRRQTRIAGFVGVVTLSCLAVWRPPPVNPAPDRSVAVALVQSEECAIGSYARLTAQALPAAPQWIVWPEYAVPYDVRQRPGSWNILTELSRKSGAVLVVGTQTEAGAGDAWYNTALVVDQGTTIGEYHKARPVHFFDDGTPGHEFTPVLTRHGKMGLLICFDTDYVEPARRTVAAGAECLVVPSFDAAEWSATQHRQHGALFRLRAAENGRWLACAASSGASQLIDPHGNVRGALPLMTQGVLHGRIALENRRTFFNRVGWLFPWLDTAAAIAVLTWAALGAWRTRKNA